MSAKQKLVLTLHEEYEMAEIKLGRWRLHFGNYWDFHAGCSGTVIWLNKDETLDFTDEWGDHIRGPYAVGKMISERLGIPLEVRRRTTPFRC